MVEDAGTRYTILTANDQAANIWVVTILTICFATAGILARGWSKGFGAGGRRLQVDDYTMLGGWSLGIVQCALIIKSLTLGLGKDVKIIKAENIGPMGNYFLASLVFAMLCLYCVKISMILLIERLFNRRLMLFWVAMTILGVVATLAVTVRCKYPTCTSPVPRGAAATALDITSELVIMILPVYCIRNIQMASYSKLKVQLSFLSRIFVVLFSILAIWALSRPNFTRTPNTAIALPAVFIQIEVCLSIFIAAILPIFRIIFQSSSKDHTSSSSGYTRDNARQGESCTVEETPLKSKGSTIGSLPPRAEHSTVSLQDIPSGTPGMGISEASPAPSGQTSLSQRSFIV